MTIKKQLVKKKHRGRRDPCSSGRQLADAQRADNAQRDGGVHLGTDWLTPPTPRSLPPQCAKNMISTPRPRKNDVDEILAQFRELEII